MLAIPALRPDWALLHVPQADAEGNARIIGNAHYDIEMSRAAKNIILTTERIVPSSELTDEPELTLIPGFLVRAVVECPGGARPCSCHPFYDVDDAEIRRYMRLSIDSEGLHQYLRTSDFPTTAPGDEVPTE